jgi:hypothetical protein
MSSSIDYKTHRLINKSSGKLSSSSTWLIDLAACAVVLKHDKGLPALLPQDKAKRLLENNQLKPFKRHNKKAAAKKAATSHDEIRLIARSAISTIAAYYTHNVVKGKSPKELNRKGFVHWITSQMKDTDSGLNRRLLASPDYAPLAETVRGERWWLDQIKNAE